MNNPIAIVLCKKDYRCGGEIVFGDFKSGEYYNDFQLETLNYEPLQPITSLYKYIYIWNKNKKGGIRFHLSKDKLANNYLPWFYDYFYDEQEIRKIKLKNLKSEI
jgi:hypothetical protein